MHVNVHASLMASRACMRDSIFARDCLTEKTKSVILFASHHNNSLENIWSVTSTCCICMNWPVIRVYLSESANIEHCAANALAHARTHPHKLVHDELFRSIFYVTIFNLAETTTSHPARLISVNANIRRTPAFKHHGLRGIIARSPVPACIRMRSNIGRTYLQI